MSRSAGRYKLARMLKEGGGGEVWLGEHPTLGTPIVVKLIRADLVKHPDARGRFEREARIAARLRSANVVQVIDYGITEDGEQYIVMEHLEGETLRDRLEARGRLSAVETAEIIGQVCRAVTKAHEEGLVHRDLKPDNIFLTKDVGGEVVKVLDFGVAKVADSLGVDGVDPTTSGVLLGTPSYMSPEQAQGMKSVDFRSDLWSLGVVAIECITGKRPFEAPTVGALFKQIVVDPVRMPSQLAPGIGVAPEVDAWAARALRRDPAARFASATELAEALRRAAEATAAPSPPAGERAVMRVRAPAPAPGDEALESPSMASTSDVSTTTLAEEEKIQPRAPEGRARDRQALLLIVLICVCAGAAVLGWLAR